MFPLSICINVLLNGGQHARTSPIWFGHMGRDFMLLKSCQLNQVTRLSPLLPPWLSLLCAHLFSSPRSSPAPQANVLGMSQSPSSAPEHETGFNGHCHSWGVCGIHRALAAAGWGWEERLWGATVGKQTKAGAGLLHPPNSAFARAPRPCLALGHLSLCHTGVCIPHLL